MGPAHGPALILVGDDIQGFHIVLSGPHDEGRAGQAAARLVVRAVDPQPSAVVLAHDMNGRRVVDSPLVVVAPCSK
jgi:hypothetical protein